jgi:hypothetical protein
VILTTAGEAFSTSSVNSGNDAALACSDDNKKNVSKKNVELIDLNMNNLKIKLLSELRPSLASS